MKPLIVCLCGSTKFREEYRRENARLTMNGCIVLSVGCFQGDPEWGTNKVNLDKLHLAKIAMSDSVFVINKDGYIGESTKNEIAYARTLKIPITYMEPIQELSREEFVKKYVQPAWEQHVKNTPEGGSFL